ncbi:hypothetical protein CDV31_001893 [Fusarium ambrosium]|uniref:Uncharacterized protein n=1 Tax=Fusarium ambrosium TaxID=131363 RepID=A0A428UYA5_9HYPO|nr:hypothetical protein CDV31_001893 [Fusarium ambrosium]
MARTRAQLAAQRGRALSAPKDQGKRPKGIHKRARRRTTSFHQRLAPEPTECDQPYQSPAKKTLSRLVRHSYPYQHRS